MSCRFTKLSDSVCAEEWEKHYQQLNIQVYCHNFTSDPELRHDNWEHQEHWHWRINMIWNLRLKSQEPCNIKWLWSNKCIARWSITKWNQLPTLLLLFRLLLIENLFTKYMANHRYLRISIPKMGCGPNQV